LKINHYQEFYWSTLSTCNSLLVTIQGILTYPYCRNNQLKNKGEMNGNQPL
jgi:hypothetical protein